MKTIEAILAIAFIASSGMLLCGLGGAMYSVLGTLLALAFTYEARDL